MQTSIQRDALPSAPPLPAILGASEKLASGVSSSLAAGNAWQTRTFTPVLRQGNDNMHARYYNPSIGRFLSVDPVGGTVGSSQSWNQYSYVQNNPIGYIDPYGERWFSVNESWEFFEGVDELRETVVNEDGSTSETTVAGLEVLVTFDGGTLTYHQADGATTSYDAVSGKDASLENGSDSSQQSIVDVGPIPEGAWSFNPSQIQTLNVLSPHNVAGLVGSAAGNKWGSWPGGMVAWGTQRAWLTPGEGTNTYGRSGFTIHGGWTPGSAGCIDMGPHANQFFGSVDRSHSRVPVFVKYE